MPKDQSIPSQETKDYIMKSDVTSEEGVKVDFKPYYLYESVTKNIHDIDDQGDEEFPPKS